MSAKLLTEHLLEFLRLQGGCKGSSESTLVKMSHGWKSHVTAHIVTFCVKSSNRTSVIYLRQHFNVTIPFLSWSVVRDCEIFWSCSLEVLSV